MYFPKKIIPSKIFNFFLSSNIDFKNSQELKTFNLLITIMQTHTYKRRLDFLTARIPPTPPPLPTPTHIHGISRPIRSKLYTQKLHQN